MQERRYTRRMRHRIRKRVVFAMAFLGFSTLFYHSVLSFKQDRAHAVAYAAPTVSTVAVARPDSIPTTPAPPRTAPLQGPVAVGLAFRINGDPGLQDQLARLRIDENFEPVVLPKLVSLR